MKIVILAGGDGTRLWPWSRRRYPKQLQSLLGEKTLLQQTFSRLEKIVPAADVLIVTGEAHVRWIREQLPQVPRANIIAEPVRRDSAGAIGVAAAMIAHNDPLETIISVHADSWIGNERLFVAHIKRMAALSKAFPLHTILTGIKPQYPETGYGYIQAGKKIVQHKTNPAHAVKRFIEKPSLTYAERYTRSKEYYWNPGWFAWRTDALLGLYKKFLPSNYRILEAIAASPKRLVGPLVKNEFPKLKSISIDYGIIERTKKRIVLPTSLAWSDIGHWRSVREMSRGDRNGNVVKGTSVLLDSHDNLFISGTGKCITSIGVKNIIMVETDDVILVADKSRAQDVKQLVEALKKKGMSQYL